MVYRELGTELERRRPDAPGSAEGGSAEEGGHEVSAQLFQSFAHVPDVQTLRHLLTDTRLQAPVSAKQRKSSMRHTGAA